MPQKLPFQPCTNVLHQPLNINHRRVKKGSETGAFISGNSLFVWKATVRKVKLLRLFLAFCYADQTQLGQSQRADGMGTTACPKRMLSIPILSCMPATR